MYSRSPRKFLQPDADHANPNLGPGCYTSDEQALTSGKIIGEDGYAPFASLAKRHCAFDNMVSINPAPGLYDITTVGPHSISKAPLFGRSNAERFTNIVSETPGPGSYQIPSHIHGLLRPKKRNGNVVNRLNVLEKSIDSVKEVVVSNDPRPHSGIRSEADFPVFKQHRDLGEVMGHSAAKGENHPEGFMARRTKQKIIWRRKYIPPSIPIGPTTFGYQETDNGELVPRRPPTKRQNAEPAYNFITSFVEKSKHENRGFKFAKASQRLNFASTVSLGPGAYDVFLADNYLHNNDSGNGPAVMTLAPCVRLTDIVIKEETKKGIPGPGYYDIKEESQKMKKGRITFGGSVDNRFPETFKAPDVAQNPGPGQYHPEIFESKKLIAQKPQPFGSTAQRFEKLSPSRNAPAPGSYNVDQINSIVQKVQSRAQIGNGISYKAFGSVTTRFKQEKNPLDHPGPGEYNPETPNNAPLGFSAYNYMHHFNSPKNQKVSDQSRQIPPAAESRGSSPKRSQVKMVVRKGPHLKIVISDGMASPSKIHVPVFGSQLERFADDNAKTIPPPGAYEVATSYSMVKSKGAINNSSIHSETRREVFPTTEKGPGPSEYEPKLPSNGTSRKAGDGFLSKKPRFFEDKEVKETPAPNLYIPKDYEKGLIRQTFNITLADRKTSQIRETVNVPNYSLSL